MEEGVGTRNHKVTFIASVQKSPPLSSADFLAADDCDLSMHEKLFTIGKHQVKCVPEHAKVTQTKVKLDTHVELPPYTEVLVSCKAGMTQPAENSWHYDEDGLVIRSSLVQQG